MMMVERKVKQRIMKSNNVTQTNRNSGVGFLGLLAVLFIGLKLTHVIAWSWWWVLAPLYGPFLLIIVVALVCGLGALIFGSTI